MSQFRWAESRCKHAGRGEFLVRIIGIASPRGVIGLGDGIKRVCGRTACNEIVGRAAVGCLDVVDHPAVGVLDRDEDRIDQGVAAGGPIALGGEGLMVGVVRSYL